jgi:hypothetical protein
MDESPRLRSSNLPVLSRLPLLPMGLIPATIPQGRGGLQEPSSCFS